MADPSTYLRRHTEALVKDIGIEQAAKLSGKSKATLGRYYSDAPEHAARFIPVDTVAALEAAASFPHVTQALADLAGAPLSAEVPARRNTPGGGINEDVIALSRRFAQLMAEYHEAIADGRISANEAKRMLAETVAIQHVLIEMKLNLEASAR
jgi:hypothetical protein